MPPNGKDKGYSDRRERLLKKLHGRQPPSKQTKFLVADGHSMPAQLQTVYTVLKDVLKLKYENNMAVYPECKFSVIDVLWCQPPNSTACTHPVPWGRARFYIEYRRAYGAFTVDFLQCETLPNDFSDDECNINEAACTIDITYRKIAMEFSCSAHEHSGVGRCNGRSNYFQGLHMLVQGWVSIDDFAASSAAFRQEAVKRNRALVKIKAEAQNNLTRPLVFLKVNADCVESVLKTAVNPPLDTMITTVPQDGKPMRMAHTFEERMRFESEM